MTILLLTVLNAVFAQVHPGTGSNEDLWQSEGPFNSNDNFLYNQDENEFREFFGTENDVFINEYEIKLLQDQERKKIEVKKKKETEIKKKEEERQKRASEFKTFVYEEYLFQNVLFGIGSGAITGVLLSKAFATNLRENLQYIGTSVFIGAIIGIFVSSKEVYFYDIPPDVVIGGENTTPPDFFPNKNSPSNFSGFNPSIGLTYRF